MKQSGYARFLVPSAMVLTLGVLFSGCGKKVEVVDSSDSSSSTQSAASTTPSGNANTFHQFQEDHKYTFSLHALPSTSGNWRGIR